MRKPEMVLTLALLGSTAMSVWLWSELQSERTRNAELSARVDSLPAPPAGPQTAVTSDPDSNVALSRAATPIAESATTPPPRVEPVAQEDDEAYLRRMLQQPKFREAWRAQQRLKYALRRENVIRLLGFTPEQADAIVELEVDRQLRWYDRTPPNPMTEEYRQQQVAWADQDQREDQARLRALLGNAESARFEEYMETRSTRMQVDQLRPQFIGADTLRDDQVEPLIAALHVERAEMQRELSEYRDAVDWEDAQSSQEFAERQIEMLKATHERMHSAASSILSGSQLRRLDALLKREVDQQEALQRMTRVESKLASPGASTPHTN